MATTKLTFTRTDIGSLAERLEHRGQSRLLNDRPELQHDLRVAAKLLRFMIEHGVPISTVDIEVEQNGRPQ